MKCYRLKYRLYIKHSFDNNIKNAHSHVIEIELHVRPETEEFVAFSQMDKMLKEKLAKYQYAYLNDFYEFEGRVTIEGICETFYKLLVDDFAKLGWIILRLSVGETPLRTYSIVVEEV